MVSNSPMSKGSVNPMFVFKPTLTPFVFILMIEIGSSPDSQNIQKTSHPIRLYERARGKQAYSFILNASQGKEGWSTGKLVHG